MTSSFQYSRLPQFGNDRTSAVLDPSVPEYFGYAGASQVWRGEPSFLDRKRLTVAGSHDFRKLRILGEISGHENDCRADADGDSAKNENLME